MNDTYNNIDEFKKEYTGFRDPSNNKWYGLEFFYNNKYYRFDYVATNISIYILVISKNKVYPDIDEYILIGEYSNIDEALNSFYIDNKLLKDIIIDDSVKILGKD